MKYELKSKFKDRYEKLLGKEAESFFDICMKGLRKSIRVNTLKAEVRDLKNRLEERGYDLKPIKWCKEGFWLDGYQLGNTLEHQLGYFYIQESASMIPPLVLNPSYKDTVLDIAASPGSKTTQMAAMMDNRGVMVANDVDMARIKALRSNLERCGIANTIVTREDGRKIKANVRFDKILVDAPCTGEGAIRKKHEIALMWNPHMINKLSRLQKMLLENAYLHLKSNGVLVYSTCTLAPEENEAVVDSLLKKFDDVKLERMNVKNVKSRHGITEWNDIEFDSEVRKCWRIYPQDNDTEGFFIAKLVRG